MRSPHAPATRPRPAHTCLSACAVEQYNSMMDKGGAAAPGAYTVEVAKSGLSAAAGEAVDAVSSPSGHRQGGWEPVSYDSNVTLGGGPKYGTSSDELVPPPPPTPPKPAATPSQPPRGGCRRGAGASRGALR